MKRASDVPPEVDRAGRLPTTASTDPVSVSISLSSEVAPQIREFPRASTASVNAYTMPISQPYLRRLSDRLAQEGFPNAPLIMLSSGGVVGADTAGEWKKVARYSDGTNQVSLFRARADVRWSDLPATGFQTVDDDRAWRGVIDRLEVFVVQRGGYAYALVGEDQAAVDAAVALLPSAKKPSLVDRMRDAAHGMVDAFSLRG